MIAYLVTHLHIGNPWIATLGLVVDIFGFYVLTADVWPEYKLTKASWLLQSTIALIGTTPEGEIPQSFTTQAGPGSISTTCNLAFSVSRTLEETGRIIGVTYLPPRTYGATAGFRF